MAADMTEKKPLDYLVRGLQLLFAIIVIGTDAYAIHVFRGHDEEVDSPVFPGGEADLHVGVPAAWGFLMFCAAWTFVVVIFHFVEPGFASHPMTGYVRIGAEAVAVLSWFAGFIAVAVNVSTTNACASGQNSCSELKAAAAFGAFEWLLFMITATPAVLSFINRSRDTKEPVSRA
ncbi:marvel domain-containing protein [Trichoderma evansii]